MTRSKLELTAERILSAQERANQIWGTNTYDPSPDIDWRQQASCIGVDPELWFPEGETHVISRGKQAKAICRGCPVAQQCLEWALTTEQRFGIWGGLNATERNKLRRQKQAAMVRTCKNGHLMDSDNIRLHSTTGHPICRTCDNKYRREYKARHKDKNRGEQA